MIKDMKIRLKPKKKWRTKRNRRRVEHIRIFYLRLSTGERHGLRFRSRLGKKNFFRPIAKLLHAVRAYSRIRVAQISRLKDWRARRREKKELLAQIAKAIRLAKKLEFEGKFAQAIGLGEKKESRENYLKAA
jgi:hypothetical protein